VSPPLEGYRLIELGNFMAAPFAGMVLADLGMDVIKVEPPGSGDHTRATPPRVGKHAAGFLALNRNKRSVVLDLKHPQGRSTFLRLAETADVILENYRPGTMADLGIDYEAVRARRPDVVFCSVSGFGQSGPDALRAGLDLVVQAESGLMSVNGHPGQEPAKVGVPISDLTAALYAANAIQAALLARARSGAGQRIDVSMLESALSLGVWETSGYFANGIAPAPTGSAHRGAAPYQAYRTLDGYITLGATTPRLWQRFCDVLDRPSLLDDERFADNASRTANRAELAIEIERTTTAQPTAWWKEKLDEAGIPCGELRGYDEVLRHPHLMARGAVVQLPHAELEDVRMVGSPMRFSDATIRTDWAGPPLGVHTREVLAELGLDDAACAELIESGAAATC
jgi:formyl-CoA transferase